MRRIAHLSDLHFGRTDAAVVNELVEIVNALEPDIVVVSGDLTQRARKGQFAEARDFLAKLPHPQIVVPGNHDVPMYNVFARFLWPLRNYKSHITTDLDPFVVDDEIAVIGLNTARSFVIKAGRVNDAQIDAVCRQIDPLSDELIKVVVTHHPFDLPAGHDEDHIVGRADEMMPRIAECGADVFLSGHLHVSSITNSAHRYRLDTGKAALVIQAGTATSTRERGEPNSFNLIEIERPFLAVKRYECNMPHSGFVLATTEQFTQTERGWSRM